MRGCLTAKFRIPIHASPSRSGFATGLGVDHVVQGPAAHVNHGHWRPVDRVLGWHLSQENVLRKTRYKDGEGIVISLPRHPSPSNTIADLTFFPRIQLQHSRILSFGIRLSRYLSFPFDLFSILGYPVHKPTIDSLATNYYNGPHRSCFGPRPCWQHWNRQRLPNRHQPGLCKSSSLVTSTPPTPLTLSLPSAPSSRRPFPTSLSAPTAPSMNSSSPPAGRAPRCCTPAASSPPSPPTTSPRP